MTNLYSINLFALVLVTVYVACRGQGKNPCHSRKWAMGRGVNCEGVHLPTLMCNKCSLKPVRPNGTFYNCKSVYNIKSKGCKEQLWKYVKANPCDEVRKEQLKRFNSADVEGLDYFIYSICEECCDCILKGTKHEDYEMLKKKHKTTRPTLYTPLRGNCPAHAHYDVSEMSSLSILLHIFMQPFIDLTSCKILLIPFTGLQSSSGNSIYIQAWRTQASSMAENLPSLDEMVF